MVSIRSSGALGAAVALALFSPMIAAQGAAAATTDMAAASSTVPALAGVSPTPGSAMSAMSASPSASPSSTPDAGSPDSGPASATGSATPSPASASPSSASASSAAASATPNAAGALTGACSQEGQWNCLGGSSFQRCASGQWSVVQAMPAGTNCQQGQSQALWAVSRFSRRWMLMRSGRE